MAAKKAWRTVEVTFGPDEKPPSGFSWEIDKVEGEMKILSIRAGTPAASKPQLRPGQMLTHVDGENVEDVEEKGMTLKQVTKMIRTRMEGEGSVTIQLKEEVDEEDGPTEHELTGADMRALSGRWLAKGEDATGPGLDELILLNVSADGVITGVVDDGDGVMEDDEGDCKITNGKIDPRTHWIEFDQEYSDGAVTHWKCLYDASTGRLINGEWSDECTGTFVATRATDPDGVERLGYQVVLPKPVTVYAGASKNADVLGQLGPGSEAVTAACDDLSMPYYDPVSKESWVQLYLKRSVEDDDEGHLKDKVLKGWVSLKASNGQEQLARAPHIDGSGVDATMLPSRRSPRKRSPNQSRRTPRARPDPEPEPEPEFELVPESKGPELEPEPEPELESELLLPNSGRDLEPEPEPVDKPPADVPRPYIAPTPSEDAIRSLFIPLGGHDIELGQQDKLLETFALEMQALNAQSDMVAEALSRWTDTLKRQHEQGCVDMTPFEEIVKNHHGICGIGDHVEELRQAMEPHYGTSGAENLNSLTPSPRRAGGNFDDSETPAHALEPMESPALSNIKRAARGSPSAFACCASPGSYDQTHSELSDETLQATKSPNSSGRKASKDKDKDTRIAEQVATFCTFHEEGTLGIRFEEADDKSLVVKGLIGKGQAARFFRRKIKKGMRVTSVNGRVPIPGNADSVIEMVMQKDRPLTIGASNTSHHHSTCAVKWTALEMCFPVAAVLSGSMSTLMLHKSGFDQDEGELAQ